MYQPEVENTEEYSDCRGECVVHMGRLVLIESDALHGLLCKDENGKVCFPENIKTISEWLVPIIISETEEIKEGDWGYGMDGLFEYKGKVNIDNGRLPNKVLALPEQFSDKHLQAIADGKMKDGDKVLVKCEKHFNAKKSNTKGLYPVTYFTYSVDLDQQNHITLFSVKKSLEEIAKEYADDIYKDGPNEGYTSCIEDFKAGWEAKTKYKEE